jgi:hypothetical protein
MTTGSHYDFLNILGRDHKDVICSLVSDAAGTNHIQVTTVKVMYLKRTESAW